MTFNNYEIFIPKNIRKSLPGVKLQKVFLKKMEYFSKNPFHPSLNTGKYGVSEKTLKRLGVDEVWEFYINRRDYRCIFYVIHRERKLEIAYIGSHNQIKRKYSR